MAFRSRLTLSSLARLDDHRVICVMIQGLYVSGPRCGVKDGGLESGDVGEWSLIVVYIRVGE